MQGNKTKNEIYAIPSYEPMKSYMPKIKAKLGADSMSYLTALLQTKVLGLVDNLGGIEITTDDGGLYNRTVGESSRKVWYNKTFGRLYISHFKTNKSMLGMAPHDFALKDIPELKNAIDLTLRPAYPKEDRTNLIDIGVDKDELPAQVGPAISQAFKFAGLVYDYVNKGKLTPTSPGPNTICHAQFIWKHRDFHRKNPSLTAAPVNDRITCLVNHGLEINQGYTSAMHSTTVMTPSRARAERRCPLSPNMMRRDLAGARKSQRRSPQRGSPPRKSFHLRPRRSRHMWRPRPIMFFPRL